MSLWPLHPALPLIAGGLLLAVLPRALRGLILVLVPVVGLVNVLALQSGATWDLEFLGSDLMPLRVDKLSLLFGYLFHLAAFLTGIYSLHVKDRLQLSTGMIYAGSALMAVFAGDLVTLFVAWELLAVTSVFQIWARRQEHSGAVGIRYLCLHVLSGLLLLAGTVIQYHETGSLAFEHVELTGLGPWCLLLAFGIKVGFPGFHTWLPDAYPAATATGTVFLSSFTTKTAVYTLARGFAGAEELLWIGAVMTLFPIFYAVIENDLRRVLSYSMINQLGFMVVGIGLGTGMGVNGAVAHAFADVFFKGLLFMAMGAVLFRTGRTNGSDLGGLYKSMPWTCGFCLIGAASISAFPLFSAFVSKSIIMTAAAQQGHVWLWLILLFAAAGVVEHAGVKIPFFAFFAHDSGLRVKEAPKNMLLAMALASILCIAIGCLPGTFYSLLPYEMNFTPYDTTHVLTQVQILFFAIFAVFALMRLGLYPPEKRAINLDFDWTWRRVVPAVFNVTVAPLLRTWFTAQAAFLQFLTHGVPARVATFEHSRLARLGQGSIVVLITVMLALFLVVLFLEGGG